MPPPDVLSAEFAADPYRFFPALLEDYPVLHHEATDAYFISRHRDVARAIRDPLFTTEVFATRVEPVMGGPILAQMEGPEHSAKNSLVIRAFNGETLKKHFAPIIERNVRELVEPVIGSGRIDIVGDFATRYAVYVTLDVLGLPKSDYETLFEWYSGVLAFATALELDDVTRDRGLRCAQNLSDYLTPVIDRRRERPGEDVISILARAEENGVRISTVEIRALCVNILVAAAEPTDKTLALLFRHLIDHPEQFAAVRRDRRLITNALAETLRYTPPVHVIPRMPAEDVELSGGTVPAGKTVFCMIAAANRDPDAFQDPDVFDINRADLPAARSFSAAANHVSFGSGRHFCVGAAFARMEIEVAANLLLDRMADIEYAEDFVYREEGIYTRGPVSLVLSYRPT